VPHGTRRPLGRGAHLRVLPEIEGALAPARRLPLGRRAADAGRRARSPATRGFSFWTSRSRASRRPSSRNSSSPSTSCAARSGSSSSITTSISRWHSPTAPWPSSAAGSPTWGPRSRSRATWSFAGALFCY